MYRYDGGTRNVLKRSPPNLEPATFEDFYGICMYNSRQFERCIIVGAENSHQI